MTKKPYMEFDKAVEEIKSIAELAELTGYITLSKPDISSTYERSFTDPYKDFNTESSPNDLRHHIANTFGHAMRGILMGLDYDIAFGSKHGEEGDYFLRITKLLMAELKSIQKLADNPISKDFVVEMATLLHKFAQKYGD